MDSVENKSASLLVVSLGKALSGYPPTTQLVNLPAYFPHCVFNAEPKVGHL